MLLTEFFKIVNEGGNLAVGGQEAEQINLKVTNRSYIVPILNDLLSGINSAFNKKYKKPLWNPELIQNQRFLSGSSLHFFNVRGIPDEVFVQKKPKVGDIDTMVPRELEAELEQFLASIQGKQIGSAKFIGFQRGNEQFSSLWELQEPPIKIQIDLEFVEYQQGNPTDWARFSHSSSWDDMSEGVKGVFHKWMINALTSLTSQDFLLRKMVGRGNARAEQNVPTTDNMISFAVSSKEGGGLRAKYEPVLDASGQPLVVDGLPVMKRLPTTGYEQDLGKIFQAILGHRVNEKGLQQALPKTWSFVGLLDLANSIFTQEEKQNLVQSMINKCYGQGAQGLYKNDPERDSAEKDAALNLMFKKLGVQPPADFKQIKADYVANYRRVSESRLFEEEPQVKAQFRKGMPHLRNLKPADLIDFLEELHEKNGAFKLANIPLNVKVDGFGGRFGKNSEGKPFMATSRTEPRYEAGFVKYHQQKGTTDPEILQRAGLFDQLFNEMMKAVKLVDSKLGPDFLVNKQVTCEVLFLPFATRTESGRLKFVGIEYDELPKGVDLALVPFRVTDATTGDDLPDGDQIVEKLTTLGQQGSVMFINNSLTQDEALDVTAIVPPMENLQQFKAMLASRKRDQVAAVKAAMEPVGLALEKAIGEDPNIVGKDILGKDYEGIVINTRMGPVKVTSPEQKQIIANKQAAKATARQEQPRDNQKKVAVVAIGSAIGHMGHQQLFDFAVKKADETGGDPYFFIGNAEGKDDPIPVPDKVKTWHLLYPQYAKNISAVTMEGGSLLQKVKHELINPLPNKLPRYTTIYIVVGKDREMMANQMASALMKAVNKFPGYENVKAIPYVTSRSEDEGGTGVSGTALRTAIKTKTPEEAFAIWDKAFNGGNFGAEKIPAEWIKHLMSVAKQNMNIQKPAPAQLPKQAKPQVKLPQQPAPQPKRGQVNVGEAWEVEIAKAISLLEGKK